MGAADVVVPPPPPPDIVVGDELEELEHEARRSAAVANDAAVTAVRFSADMVIVPFSATVSDRGTRHGESMAKLNSL